MTKKTDYQAAAEDAIRALRDIADLDETRPAANDPEKVARRSLERIAALLGDPTLTAFGRTPRPGEPFRVEVETDVPHV